MVTMSGSSPLRASGFLQATYTGLAPIYDALVPNISSEARATGQSSLQVQDGEQVLDVGTGTGLALRALVAANPSGWTEGVDATPAMLARARRRLADCDQDRYRLRFARAADLPYPADAFDAVFSSYLVDVLPRNQLRPALGEMRRVLRAQGRLVLVYLTAPERRIERLWVQCACLFVPLFGGARPIHAQSALRDCGFEVQTQTTRSQLGLRSVITKATPV